MMKRCGNCKEIKDLSCFGKDKRTKSGLHYCCKNCKNEKHKKYYINNKEKINEKHKKYNSENQDKIKEYNLKRKEIKKIYNQNYILSNKEYLKEYHKNYNIINKEKRNEYRKQYDIKNRKLINKKRNEKENNDPIFKFKIRVRGLIKTSFKRGKNQFKKNAKTENILGCTIEEFIIYIKSKFTKGMTLENHGEWHLDHIIPLASATTEDEIIKLNHYTNFQPLWAKENLSKSDKIIEKQLKLI
jgi:hypothetical protein